MNTIAPLLALSGMLWALPTGMAQRPEPDAEPQPQPIEAAALAPAAPNGNGPSDAGPGGLPEPDEAVPPGAPAAEAADAEEHPPAEHVETGAPAAAEGSSEADAAPARSGRDAGYVIAPARREGTRSAPVTSSGAKNLRLNFRGAPLELVLDYLSEAAGFIIILETEVKGKLDVWSNQPLSQAEAVELLNQILAKNGYAAIQDGRTLTILAKDEAKKRDTPVRSGSDPASIPRGDQVITQIIPVKFVNAVQLSRDLQPLFPTTATIAANEGGNALVITDTQTNIRRVAEIIKALDTAISSVSSVRVFPLHYADAKSLATVIRDLFQAQNSARSGSGQQQVFRGFRGGGGGGGGMPGLPGMMGGGGFGGQGGGQGGQSSGASRVSSPSVVAVADERSNAVVVSAPEDQMPVIEDLVKQVDINVDDITELRVFSLKYGDPQEMADLLTELFPENSSSSSQSGRGQFRFGGPGGFGGFGGSSSSSSSSRTQQQNRVTAVPDLRTKSVVVSASRELMPEIAQIVTKLDSDPAKKQKVHVFSVENSDPAAVEEILRGLFETQNSRNRSTTSRSTTRQAGSQLNSRATSNLQNQGRTSSRTGTSGFGTTSGMR